MPVHIDKVEILRTFHLLVRPGEVCELRALEVSSPPFRQPHTESGYFDEPERFVRAV